MVTRLDSLFCSLAGAWSVSRTITDHRMGSGHFDGHAVFTRQGDSALICDERGELVIGGWRGPAFRRWLYVREESRLSILYPDGETLLHSFDFDADTTCAEHTHLCGKDQYRAGLVLTADGGFTLSYSVDGPSKRYALRTAYVRQEELGTTARTRH